MKKTFKFATAALAVFGLASCSNDDFFGQNDGFSSDQVTLEVTVENPQGETRANAYGASDAFDWVVGDELRIYDNQLQKFDYFTYKTAGTAKAFVRTNDDPNPQYVETYVDASDESKNAYALFGGGDANNQISYNGWKQGGTTGTPVALVYIPNTLAYSESTVSTDATKFAYKAALPMWGRVSAAATENAQFSAQLNWLTAYAKITFDNADKMNPLYQPVEVRATSYKWTDDYKALDDDKKAALKAYIKKGELNGLAALDGTLEVKKTNNTSFDPVWKPVFADLTDDGAPLWGWFDAELKENGIMSNATDGAVAQPLVARNVLKINTENQMIKGTSVVYVPIIVQDYDLLVLDYEDANGDSYIISKYTDKVGSAEKPADVSNAIWRGARFAPTIEFPNTTNILDGTTCAKITDGIATVYGDGSKSAIINFNAKSDGTTGTEGLTVNDGSASVKTIYLPKINKDLMINIMGTAKTELNTDLIIADEVGAEANNASSEGVVIINFPTGFKASAKAVKITSNANIVLAGDYTALTAAPVLTGNENGRLALGVPGTTPYPFVYKADLALDITNGDLNVAAAKDGADNKTLALTYSGNKALVVADAITTLDVAATAASATVKALVSTSINTSKNIEIDAPGIENPILKVNKGVTEVTLKGGIIGDIQEGATAYETATGTALTVTSSGLSAIRKTIEAVAAGGKVVFTSSLAVPRSGAQYVNAFGHPAAAATGKIYTAAQLAAIGQSSAAAADGTASDNNIDGFELKTNITSLTNWKSPNLLEAFAGGKAASNGLTITGVDAPLFGTVSADISNVDLTVAINKNENTIGGLAKINGASVHITNVKVAGTIAGTYNVGGIFGTTKSDAANTITIGNQGTAADKVEVTATFTNKTNYTSPYNGRTELAGTFGKFIGQAAANTTVVIATECAATAAFDKTALHFDYNRIANGETGMNEWQFKGNTDYIGYSPNAVSLTYGGVAYTAAAFTTDADGAGRLAYNNTTKKVTGNVYGIGVLYTNLTAAQKAAIKTQIAIDWTGYNAANANWSGVTVKSHNLFEPFGAE